MPPFVSGIPDAAVAVFPLGLIVFYFIGTMLSIANYSGFFRFNEEEYGSGLTDSYIAFTVIGTMTYFIISGPAWVWAAKYSPERSNRIHRIGIGIVAIFFAHDLPLFIMEYHAILCCGWKNGLQGFVFVFQHIEFILSFSFGWLTYAYAAAGFLHTMTDGRSGDGLKTGAAPVAILPPISPLPPSLSYPSRSQEREMSPRSGSRAYYPQQGPPQWDQPQYSAPNSPGGVPLPQQGLDTPILSDPQPVRFDPVSARSSRHLQPSQSRMSATQGTVWANSHSPPGRVAAVPLREGTLFNPNAGSSDDEGLALSQSPRNAKPSVPLRSQERVSPRGGLVVERTYL